MNTHLEFADTVALIKRRTGETNQQLAEVIGVSMGNFGQRMLGRTEWKLSEVQKLAEHWGIEVSDLVMGPERGLRAYDQGSSPMSQDLNTAGPGLVPCIV